MRKSNILKRIFTIFILAVLCSTAVCAGEKVRPAKKLRVGFYVDAGSQGGGVLKLARLISYTPQFELILLDGKDLRDGKLSEIDLLLVPGGSSQMQYQTMQESGAQAVRDFVSAGGSYFGVCAGFHCAMNRPERIKLLPYGRKGSAGYQGPAAVEISEEGAKLLGVSPGRILGYYSLGPISIQEKDWQNSSAKTLALFKNSSTQPMEPTNKMFNSPAIIFGNHGKGKVVATSFHPEVYKNTNNIVFGCINLVTGVKGKPVFPRKNRRPVRAAFYAASLCGKEYVPVWLDLDRHADISAVTVTSRDIDTGALDNADVLVIPPGNEELVIKQFKNRRYLLKPFIDRGGVVLTRSKDIAGIIKHKNMVVVPEGKSFVPYVLQEP